MDFLPEGVCVSVLLSAEKGSLAELFITALRGRHGGQSKEFSSVLLQAIELNFWHLRGETV